MSLVPRDEMTTLRSASESASTAKTAEDDVQLLAVAHAINQAANTGLYQVVFQTKLRENVKAELESKGYTIKYISNNAYDMEHNALIIWREQPKAGDKLPEPSNSGPKYNTAKEDEEAGN